MKLKSLFSMEKGDLLSSITELGFPKWRGGQIWSWIYSKGVNSFEEMSNLSKDIKKTLSDSFSLNRPLIVKNEKSVDGTEKFALKLEDDEVIEMVFIPDEDRGTLCVSSQVGCSMKCSFCYTGTQGFTRNLSTEEIVGQVLLMRDLLNDQGSLNNKRTLTNIVFMGMGEPLYNYDNVAKAVKIIMDEDGLAFSKRRITISTSGVIPFMERCGEELGVNLAVSLHGPNDEIRDSIMPINKIYPIKEIIRVCRDYPGVNTARKITFEYVMLNNVNDSDDCAKQLVNLVRNLQVKVNIIPFNPWPNSNFVTSTSERIISFSRILTKHEITNMVRTPRGKDISAACGQLKTKF